LNIYVIISRNTVLSWILDFKMFEENCAGTGIYHKNIGTEKMSKIRERHQGKKPDPERVSFLRSLPVEVKARLTGAETEAFMYGEELPPSLLEKLKDYLVEDEG
jgi:hypothetical protein